jgi:hypothetical protein
LDTPAEYLLLPPLAGRLAERNPYEGLMFETDTKVSIPVSKRGV